MKCVVLAGGVESRIAEESQSRPKPMVEIGGRPILWHVLKIYSAHGINDLIICMRFKGYAIKEYFVNYFLHMSVVTFDMQKNSMEVHEKHAEPWRVTVVDTGKGTMTGGRLKRVPNYIGHQTFCMTYGDGVGDVDITAAIASHKKARNNRKTVLKKETDYLDTYIRGVYARRDLKPGELITDEDIYMAIPLQKGQISTRELMLGKYGHRIIKQCLQDQPLTLDHIDAPYAKDSALRDLISARGL